MKVARFWFNLNPKFWVESKFVISIDYKIDLCVWGYDLSLSLTRLDASPFIFNGLINKD